MQPEVGAIDYPMLSHTESEMLILTRKEGETIAIGNDVTVTVLGIHAGQVKLGIQAPAYLSVHREEVWQRLNALTAA